MANRRQVTLLYFDGCPNWRAAQGHLQRVVRELAVDVDIEVRRVESPEDAERLGFVGSPTILIDGEDPFATGMEQVGMSCRVYRTPEGFAGAPSVDQLREALGR